MSTPEEILPEGGLEFISGRDLLKIQNTIELQKDRNRSQSWPCAMAG